MKNLLSPDGFGADRVQTGLADDGGMADLLSVLGILAFALAMLGLIWALERV
jgi:hypothetical protein